MDLYFRRGVPQNRSGHDIAKLAFACLGKRANYHSDLALQASQFHTKHCLVPSDTWTISMTPILTIANKSGASSVPVLVLTIC